MVFIICFVGVGTKTKAHDTPKKDKNKDILILNKLDFFMLFYYIIISCFCESFISKYEFNIK